MRTRLRGKANTWGAVVGASVQRPARTPPESSGSALTHTSTPRPHVSGGAAALRANRTRPASTGNLGSIIRSCHALGADGLLVTGPGTDVYHPVTVRASMGSLFALPTVRLASRHEMGRWAGTLAAALDPDHRGRPVQIVGTGADAPLSVAAVDLTLPTVLVLGNEAEGLTPAYRELCDILVRIPMHGDADSINVACAAAVVLYEADRQRRLLPLRDARPGRPGRRRA